MSTPAPKLSAEALLFLPLRTRDFEDKRLLPRTWISGPAWRHSLPLLLAHVPGLLLSLFLLVFLPPPLRLSGNWNFLVPLVPGLLLTLFFLSRLYTRLRSLAVPQVGRLNPEARKTLFRSDFLFVLRLLLPAAGLPIALYYWSRLLNLPLAVGFLFFYIFVALLQHLLTVLPWELLLYLVFGGFTTLVSVASFTFFDALLNPNDVPGRPTLDWTLPKLLSFILAILFAYATNRRYVFTSHAPILPEFLHFAAARTGASLVLEGGGLYLLVNLIGWNKQVSNLTVAVLVVVVNYVWSKLSIFRPHRAQEKKEESAELPAPDWTYEEAQAYLNRARIFGKKKGLIPMRRMLDELGSPDRRLRFVHLAGTNGKGSAAATLASIFASAGLRTGLYTSPFIEHFNERIRILDGPASLQRRLKDRREGEIRDEAFASALGRVKVAVDRVKPELTESLGEEWNATFFELLTTAALVYYAEQGCEVVVWETGLGGRLDSTNVIDAPAVTVLTALNYDHCEYLGDTLPEIAGEKAGIIKPGSVVFAYSPFDACDNHEEARGAAAVIRERAAACKDPLFWIDRTAVSQTPEGLSGQRLELRTTLCSTTLEKLELPVSELFTPLLGDHQAMNVTLAVWAAESYLSRYTTLDAGSRAEALCNGLLLTRWPARLEVLRQEPPILLDGAHNVQGARALGHALPTLLGERRPVLVCGFLEGREETELLRCLLDQGVRPLSVYCVPPNEPRRAKKPEHVAEVLRPLVDCPVVACETLEDFWTAVLPQIDGSDGAPLVCFGSLYLAGPFSELVRGHLQEHYML